MVPIWIIAEGISTINQNKVAVIGAGIVGTACALELQRRGLETIMFDRSSPGSETSYGNAGVLSNSSVVIVNNPTLPFKLPKMLTNNNLSLSYNLSFVLSRLPWIVKFLFFATKSHMHHAGRALRNLQVKSLDIHKSLITEANVEHLLRNTGWLQLYRSKNVYEANQGELDFLREMGVAFTIYSAEDLQSLESCLKPIYYKGILMTEACSVSSPSELTEAYVGLFEESGGTFIQKEVRGLATTTDGAWKIHLDNGDDIKFANVVIAAGPWSAEIAQWLGYKIPMAWERGYHAHLEPLDSQQPQRPIHDVEGGFVIAPMNGAIRILTGVELTYRDAPPNHKQIRAAVKAALEASDFGPELDVEPWLGCRPTLVDSLPMIGPSTKHKGLWFNFGHQHVGLSTATGSAQILADLIGNHETRVDHTPFRPDRFRI